MPAPLIWLGAGLAALYLGETVSRAQQKQSGQVTCFPGEGEQAVIPYDGAVVCCGIYGVFEHTGIWLEDGIVELKGNGLIRAVSPERFVQERSGNQIYLACDTMQQPLVSPQAASRAASQLYQYSRYHLLNNNCHRFVWQCVSGQSQALTRFRELNQALSEHFHTSIAWQPVAGLSTS